MKLPITITQDGLSALIDAEAGTTNKVRVAAIALSSVPFITAPTLEALPGEFKRLDTISGDAVSENVLHMTASDDAAESYTVTGFGLILDNGQLFGVFSQPVGGEPLFEKSSASTFLFAADVTFEAGEAALIEFGDANFLYPPATTGRKGVAYLATQAEVTAGVDAEKIVTPATLKGGYIPVSHRAAANGVASLGADGKIPPSQLPPVDSIDTFYATSDAEMTGLAAAGPGDFCQRTDLNKTFRLAASPPSVLANWVEFLSPGAPVRSVNGKIGDVVLGSADVGAAPVGRNVTGGGLVTGGGDLSADRQLVVAIATAAEAAAGVLNDRAVTPAALATLISVLAGKPNQTRRVDAAGLATGGGDLSADRVITVPKATAADVEGLTDDTKAVTAAALAGTLRSFGAQGYLRIPGTPLIIQWGSKAMPGAGGTTVQTVAFPFAYPSACAQVFAQWQSSPNGGDESDEVLLLSAFQRTGFTATLTGDHEPCTFGFFAIGW